MSVLVGGVNTILPLVEPILGISNRGVLVSGSIASRTLRFTITFLVLCADTIAGAPIIKAPIRRQIWVSGIGMLLGKKYDSLMHRYPYVKAF